jgi:hypothetical protein
MLRPGGIFLVAALARLAYLWYSRPFFTTEYWQLAGSLLHRGELGFPLMGPTTAYEPLYPAFLAVLRFVASDRALAVQAGQALVAAAGVVWLYRLTERLAGRGSAAVYAGLLFAFNPVLVRHAVSPSEFSLMATLLLIFASTFVTAAGPAGAIRAGLWLGLAVLTRAMALPLVALAPAVFLLEGRRTAALGVALTALAVVTPMAARNYTVNGVMLPTRSGMNLFIGNSEYSARLIPEHSPDVLQEYARATAREHGLVVSEFGIEDEKAADRLFTRLALDQVREHPGKMLRLKARNAVYFFWPRLVPERILTGETVIELSGDGGYRIENSPSRSRLEQAAYTVSYGFLFMAAVAGIWIRRRDLRRDRILWALLLTFVAAAVVYFPATRYRTPVEFVLVFYAAVAIERLTGRA